jgi:GntR family transcriptional regulator/MocR family aminotransferase
MQISIELDSQSNQSLQNQIFEAIRQQILSGVLKSGILMLSSRALSEQLNVSRNTVIFAYDRLIDEGYLYSKRTVGTFVNANLPDRSLILDQEFTATANNLKQRKHLSANRHPVAFDGRVQTLFNPHRDRLDIDFWVGRPDPESFPTNTWRQLVLKNLATAGSSMTEYHDPAGIIELRQAITDHIRAARGISCRAEQIIITNGIQEGMNLVARLLITPGTIAVTESPCYQGAAYVLESYGAKLHPVPVDKDGLDVDQLPQYAVGLAYVTPSHQYPFGATLPLERRIRLLQWAQQTGAYIIEDDYDSDFRHQSLPLTAVAGQDQHGCVIYMGTFSKSIGAALRIGYLVLPQELVSPAVTLSTLMNNGHSWLDQAVLSDFISSGSYLKHLRRIRRTYLKRRNCLVEALKQHFGDDVTLSGLEGGMHLVWHLDEALPTSQDIQAIAQKIGIGVYAPSAGAAHDYNDSQCCKHAILLGYSSTNENQINEGVARLAEALKT